MSQVTMNTVTDIERENLRRCIDEIKEPIGARNWDPDPKIIAHIKTLGMPERLTRIKTRLRESVPTLYIKDRGRLVTESYMATEGEDANVRQAKALAHILEEYPVYIREDELIVGAMGPTPRAALWFPEIVDWLVDEMHFDVHTLFLSTTLTWQLP